MTRPERPPNRPGVHVERSYTISDGDDKPIAHVQVYERLMGLWVTNLWVREDKRGNGLGRQVMERLIVDLNDRDLYLSVSPYSGDPLSADDLIAFYETLGFLMTNIRGIMVRKGAAHG